MIAKGKTSDNGGKNKTASLQNNKKTIYKFIGSVFSQCHAILIVGIIKLPVTKMYSYTISRINTVASSLKECQLQILKTESILLLQTHGTW